MLPIFQIAVEGLSTRSAQNPTHLKPAGRVQPSVRHSTDNSGEYIWVWFQGSSYLIWGFCWNVSVWIPRVNGVFRASSEWTSKTIWSAWM